MKIFLFLKFVKNFVDHFFDIFIERINFRCFKNILFLINFEKNVYSFFLKNVDKIFFLSKLRIFINNELN